MAEKMEDRINKKAEYIQTIREATGWTEKEAEKHLKEAKKVGMSNKRYVTNKAWRLTIEEIESMNNRIEARLKEKAEFVQKVCDATGMSRELAEEKLAEAKAIGIPLERYVENKCWNLTAEQIKALNAHLEDMELIRQETGWDQEKIEQEFARAAGAGITNSEFVSYAGWEFTDEELAELRELLILKREHTRQAQEWHVNVVLEKTGWTRDYALNLMKIASKKGYSYKAFIRRALWQKTQEEIEALPPFKRKMSETKKKSIQTKAEKAKEYRAIIMEEMGWSAGRTRLEALRAEILCGASDAEFFLFRIYRHGIEKGREFITAEYNARMNTRYAGWDGSYKFFENKGVFNRDFKEYIRRRWFLSKGLSFEEFEEQVAGLDKIICKPLNGIEGIGIEIFKLDGTKACRKEVYEKIRAKGDTIVEQFIKQHHEISEFYPNSVNTMRVMSFLDHGEGKILNSVIKFGTKANVDNYYQGGIAAGINVETGVICTDGVDYAGNVYKTHPYSGKAFYGFRIPNWDKVVELIRTAATVHRESPYVGWDIAITEDGPEIVEGNHNQGAYLCQYPFAIYSMEGRRHTIDPYLWFD